MCAKFKSQSIFSTFFKAGIFLVAVCDQFLDRLLFLLIPFVGLALLVAFCINFSYNYFDLFIAYHLYQHFSFTSCPFPLLNILAFIWNKLIICRESCTGNMSEGDFIHLLRFGNHCFNGMFHLYHSNALSHKFHTLSEFKFIIIGLKLYFPLEEVLCRYRVTGTLIDFSIVNFTTDFIREWTIFQKYKYIYTYIYIYTFTFTSIHFIFLSSNSIYYICIHIYIFTKMTCYSE